jgi:hypothetical protein
MFGRLAIIKRSTHPTYCEIDVCRRLACGPVYWSAPISENYYRSALHVVLVLQPNPPRLMYVIQNRGLNRTSSTYARLSQYPGQIFSVML